MTLPYEQWFIEHNNNRWRLNQITHLRIAEGRSSHVKGVEFKLVGDTYQDYTFIPWTEGGSHLWELIGESTVILKPLTKNLTLEKD